MQLASMTSKEIEELSIFFSNVSLLSYKRNLCFLATNGFPCLTLPLPSLPYLALLLCPILNDLFTALVHLGHKNEQYLSICSNHSRKVLF